MKFLVALAGIVISALCFVPERYALAQPGPPVLWQNTIGGSGLDELYSVQQTADGGFILGGRSFSDTSGDKTANNWDATLMSSDYWIVKTDASGNVQWDKTIGGNRDDWLRTVVQTSDGGYLLGGTSDSDSTGNKTEKWIGTSGPNWDYWIVKTDSAGTIEWQNTIGGSDHDEFRALQQTADNGFILGGYSLSGISGDKNENPVGNHDYWIVKTDSLGNIQWQNTIGGTSFDILYAVRQTADNGYIVGGKSKSNISGDKTENSQGDDDYWVVKTDSVGDIEWENTIGGSSLDVLFSVEQTTDGGYMLGGLSHSNLSGDKLENNIGFADYWIVKTDSAGKIVWQNTIGGTGEDRLLDVRQAKDGGYVLGGYSSSNISGDKTENAIGSAIYTDYWVVKVDASGNIEWDNTIGGSNDDILHAIIPAADTGYVLAGYSYSDISGDKTEDDMGGDYWLVRLAPDSVTGTGPVPPTPTGELWVYPNPMLHKAVIYFPNARKEKFSFMLYDMTGRLIEEKKTIAGHVVLERGPKQPGLYLFRLTGRIPGQQRFGKIIIAE